MPEKALEDSQSDMVVPSRGERFLRVCMLTTRFPPDYGGGARHALHLCRKLAERGVESFVIAGHKGEGIVTDRVASIPVTRVPLPEPGGLGVPTFYMRLLPLLIHRRCEYDIIHAHAVHHHAHAGFLAGRLLGKPAIAKIALLGHDDPASIAQRRSGGIQLRMIRQASALVATSQEMVRAVADHGWPEHRLAHIPNGVDTERFYPLLPASRAASRAPLGLPTDALVVSFVGLMVHRKGVHALARAWCRVKQACPEALLLLVGPNARAEHWGVDDAYVAEVKAALAQSRVIDSVRFVGQVSNPEAYLQSSDLFTFPSQGEGMPNALLEAMSCGLPFVATRLGCIQEMAPAEQRPYLVPVDDDSALSEAIIALARDSDLRRKLGVIVRQTVEERFSLDAVADRYVKLYRDLLEDG